MGANTPNTPQPVKRSNTPAEVDRKYAHVTIATSFEDDTIKGLVDKLAELIDTHNKTRTGRYSHASGPKNITYVIEGNLLTKEAFEATFENTK